MYSVPFGQKWELVVCIGDTHPLEIGGPAGVKKTQCRIQRGVRFPVKLNLQSGSRQLAGAQNTKPSVLIKACKKQWDCFHRAAHFVEGGVVPFNTAHKTKGWLAFSGWFSAKKKYPGNFWILVFHHKGVAPCATANYRMACIRDQGTLSWVHADLSETRVLFPIDTLRSMLRRPFGNFVERKC